MSDRPAELFHYTCAHSAELIRRRGEVLPLGMLGNLSGELPRENRWMLEVSWFTDLDAPDVAALGLTSVTLECDRTEWRVTAADQSSLVPWSEYARSAGVPRDQRDALESGHRPAHWWVSQRPVPVQADSLVRAASGASA